LTILYPPQYFDPKHGSEKLVQLIFQPNPAKKMSRHPSYPLTISADKLLFRFVSTGSAGNIVKLVRYEAMPTGLWNLGFGDANEDESDFDDSIVTNNNDMRKVLQTVFKTILLFTDAYPNRKIYIEPVDKRRKLLYNRAFYETHEDVASIFLILAVAEGMSGAEKYDPQKEYDAFVLKRIHIVSQ
jgi:hypothetical protein